MIQLKGRSWLSYQLRRPWLMIRAHSIICRDNSSVYFWLHTWYVVFKLTRYVR